MNMYITRSLAHWEKNTWSKAEMDALFTAPENETLLKLSLQKGLASLKTGRAFQADRAAPIEQYFGEIARRCPDLNLDLYLCTADHPELIIGDTHPFFTFAKTLKSNFILIPDQFFTRDFSRYHRSSPGGSLDADVDRASLKNPWSSKKSLAVFRSNDFKYAEICMAALAMEGEVDAKIASQPEKCAPELRRLRFEELAEDYPAERLCGPRLDIEGQVACKYLLNTPACWDSTYWKLRSNSLLFSLTKIHNHSKDGDHLSTHQWYDYFMEPYRHYIPCTMDDLSEKLAWAREHDREAQHIAEEGSRLAKNDLSYEKSLSCVGGLLRQFAQRSLANERP